MSVCSFCRLGGFVLYCCFCVGATLLSNARVCGGGLRSNADKRLLCADGEVVNFLRIMLYLNLNAGFATVCSWAVGWCNLFLIANSNATAKRFVFFPLARSRRVALVPSRDFVLSLARVYVHSLFREHTLAARCSPLL